MEYLRSDSINVYTDGSQKSKPRRGGFGIIYVTEDDDGEPVVEDIVRTGYEGATNQQMELWAVIEALRELANKQWTPVDVKKHSRITFFMDSAYVLNGVKSARFQQADGWSNRDGKPVSNSHLWELFLEAEKRSPLPVYYEKVKAHSGNEYNNLADAQAKKSADKRAGRYLPGAAVARRKLSPNQVKVGSIRPHGQIELIHVVTEKPEKGAANIFKVEVVDAASKDFECVDLYAGDLSLGLRPHHAYWVQLNDDPKNPQILNVLHEVPRDEIVYSDDDEAEDDDAGS